MPEDLNPYPDTSHPILKRLRVATAITTAWCVALQPVFAFALPVGGQVNGGSAVIDIGANNVNVTQTTNRAVIDWNSFNVGNNESVNFNQPSSSAIALNRIHDANPSQINGAVTANGNVWIINQHGVMFGGGAQVNVGGLLATTSSIDDDRFMNGDYTFNHAGDPNATISNAGSIIAGDGGSVALVAPNVDNSGTIQARLGKVQLGSGDSFAFDLFGDGLINLQASEAITDQVITNTGSIIADGGSVLLTAAAAQNSINSLINADGLIQANSVEEHEGHITIYAEGSNAVKNNIAENKGIAPGISTVMVTGTLSAAGDDAGEKGGKVDVLADHVALMSTSLIIASGESGGGTVKVGGDYRGEGDVATALATIMQNGARINANATDNGDGGKVTVWADDYTYYGGHIEAKGGANGGDGGFVETSGKQVLDAYGNVNASAPHGNAGTWLLDPDDLVVNGAADTNSGSSPNWVAGAGGGNVLNTNINTALDAGTDVTLTATGNITFASSVAKTSGADATLSVLADGNIVTNAGISITSNSNKLNVVLHADHDGDNSGYITIGGAITSNGGNITIGGGADINTGYAIGGAGQSDGISIDGSFDISAGAGNIVMRGKGAATGGGAAGIYANNYAGIKTSSGSISLTGIGGTAGGHGIDFGQGGVPVYIGTTGGNITMNGTGGAGAGTGVGGNYGIRLRYADISTTGSGTISLTGQGGGSGAGSGYDYGINQGDGPISATGGAITITATGGSGTLDGGYNDGFHMGNSITNTGTGTITVNATGGAGTNSWGMIGASAGIISAVNGAVSVTGLGGASGGGGVGLDDGIIRTTGNGSVTVLGTARGAKDTWDLQGIYIDGAGAANANITSAGGNISVTGVGTTGQASDSYGLYLSNRAQITNTGGGTLDVTGTGGGSGVGSGNYGVYLTAAQTLITSATGNITVTGTGGAGTGGTNYGVRLASNADITSTGAATITLNGIGGAGANNFGLHMAGATITIGGASATGNITFNADTWSVANASFQTTGNVYIRPYSQNGTVGVNGATGNLGVTSAILGFVNAAGTVIGRADGTGLMRVAGASLSATTVGHLTLLNGSANIQFDGGGTALTLAANKNFSATTTSGDITAPTATGTIQTQGTGTITLTSGRDINESFALALTSGGGAINLYANRNIIDIGAITSSGGAVLLNSDRDADSSGYINVGANITSNGGNITMGGGSGAITAGAGYAYGNGGQASGIYIHGTVTVAAGGGNVVMNGRGYNTTTDSNHGVYINDATVSTTGTGTITTYGIGGGASGNSATNYGVYLGNTGVITTVNGNNTITGTGGGAGSGAANYGIYIAGSNSSIQTTGLGAISATGTGGNASGTGGTNYGVYLSSANNIQATSTGNITVVGTGGSGSGSGADNDGVAIGNGSLSGAGGAISITGTGSNNGATSKGVVIANGAMSNTGNGSITIAGTGGSGAAGVNEGVRVDNSDITAVNGVISITGTGGSAGNNNYGVRLVSPVNITSTGSSTITITGIVGAGSSYGILTAGGANTIGGASATGDITLIADTVSLAALTNVQTTGNITVRPYTAATTIGVGAGAGTLTWTDTYLGYLTWGTVAANKSLTIGDVNSGDITIDTASTIADKNVNIITGGDILVENTTFAHAGGTASSLNMYAYGNITTTSALSAGGSAWNILLNSDRDANSDGYINIGGAITSNGGNITLGGGNAAITAGVGYAYGNAGSTFVSNYGASNAGVLIQSAVVNAGAGNIIVNGHGYDDVGVDNNFGVALESGQLLTTSGNITINGVGGNGAARNDGLYMGNSVAGITTTSGAITVTGTGNGSGASYGIYTWANSTITSTGSGVVGNVQLIGNGVNGGNGLQIYHAISTVDADIILQGNNNTTNLIGVYIPGTVESTGGGDITITGAGGNNVGGFNDGVHISGTVSTTTGNMVITGTGGLNDWSQGVKFNVNNIYSTSGNITITGIAGTGASHGIACNFQNCGNVGNGSTTGNITLIADTIFFGGTPLTVETTGNITLRQYTNGTTIGVGAGAGTLSWTDTYLGYLTWGTVAGGKSLTIGDVNSGDITINTASTILNKSVNFISGGDITLETTALAHAGGAASTLGMYAEGNITTSSAITAVGSALTVLLHSDYDNASGGSITIDGGITSNGGNITIGGGSNIVTDYAQGTTGAGIDVTGAIDAGGGNIILRGQGGTNGNNSGIYIADTIQTSGAGTITITGIGPTGNTNFNYGLYIDFTSTISTSGTGTITLNGTGGGAAASGAEVNIGIYLENDITSAGGDIVITAQGGLGTGGSINDGLVLAGLSTPTISTTGNGNITINGTGGDAGGLWQSNGVRIEAGTISVADGTLTIIGDGSADKSDGVVIVEDNTVLIRSTGTGNINITGTAHGDWGSGVWLDGQGSAAANITAVNGNIHIIGIGTGGGGDEADNYGVIIEDRAQVTTTGTGNITVEGTGGGSGNGTGNHGVYITGTSSRIATSSTGDIIVIGEGGNAAGSGGTNYGVYCNIANCITASNSGSDITVTGTGGHTSGTGTNNYGVYVPANRSITGAGGTMIITGTGGTSSSNGQVGVLVTGASSAITNTGGSLTVTGYGGGALGNSANNYGVQVGTGGTISNTTGTLTVTGTGGGAGTGANNYGVYVTNGSSIASSSSATITVTGIRGGGAAASNFGLATLTGTNTIGGSSTTGDITLIADTISLDANTDIETDGNITVRQYTNGVTIGVGAGAGTLTWTDTYLGYLTWGTVAAGKKLTIGDTNSGNITINTASTIANKNVDIITGGNISLITTAFAHAGGTASTLNMRAYGDISTASALSASGSAWNIVLNSDYDSSGSGYIWIKTDADITSNGGNITMGGGADPTTTAAFGNATHAYGVDIDDAVITAGAGNISIIGAGRTNGSDKYGVYIHCGARCGGNRISTTGTLTITGNGGGSGAGNNNHGVFVNGGSDIILGGTINITGTAGNTSGGDNNGVLVGYTSIRVSSGSLTVTGTGSGTGANNSGVMLINCNITCGSLVTTGAGNISVTGQGSTNGTNNNYGIYVGNDGYIQTSSTGTITLDGTGGGSGTGQFNKGIFITEDGVVESTAVGGGGITLIGQGGSGSGDGNQGIAMEWGGSTGGYMNTVDGHISITGTSGAGAGSFVEGVVVGTSSEINSTGAGNITIVGTSTSTGNNGIGVEIYDGAVVHASGTGNISITGTGSATGSGAANYGVWMDGPAAPQVLAVSGTTTITSIKGAGTTEGFLSDNTVGINIGDGSTTGNITMIQDGWSIGSGTTWTTTGNITLKQYTAATTIGVGAGAGTLSITDTYLGYMTWGTVAGGKSLTIGDSNSGNIAINTASTIADKNVNIITGGNINVLTTAFAHAGGTASALNMYANGNITINKALSASGSAWNILLNADRDANTSGYITIADAITSNGGNITMGGGSGAITANSGYAVGNGGQAAGILINNVAVAAGGGNIIVNGEGYNTTTDSNFGVRVTGASGALTTTGAGTVTVYGVGKGIGNSAADYGVYVDTGSVISGVDGTAGTAVTVNGTGGGAGSGTGNFGVYITGANSTIKSTGTGTVSVTGVGGNGAGSGALSHGVMINVADGIQSTSTGNIIVNGTGSNSSDGGNIGVYVFGSVTAAGGNISVTGTSGNNAGDSNWGVYATGGFGGGIVSTTGTGTITITGVAQGTGNSGSDYGVYLQSGAVVSAVNGAIAVTGTGGGAGTGNTNHGVYITDANSTIKTTGSGAVTLTGIKGNGAAARGIFIDTSNGAQTTGSGNIIAITDSISLGAATALNSVASLTVKPYTLGTTIGVGTGAGTLSITDAYLGDMAWGAGKFLTIGDTVNTGAMEINSGYTFAKPVQFITKSGSDITTSGQLTSSSSDVGTNAAVVLASGDDYINSAGASVLNMTGGGRWLIYSTAPADNTLNGLVLPMEKYSKTFGGYPPSGVVEVGSVMFYSTAASGSVTITVDAKTITYGAALPAFTYQFSCSDGCLQGDVMIGGLSLTGAATTSTSGNVEAGIWAILQGTLDTNNGYTVNFTGANLTVNQKGLTITGMTASNKAYDGLNTATLNHAGEALVGVVDGLANGGGGPVDIVTIDTSGASGTFNNANVGNGKTVTAAGITLGGADAANYTLTQPTTTANITAANLTITADDQTKTYGFGGTSAALGTVAFTPVGLQNGETIGGVTLSTNATLSTSTNYNAGLWAITPSAATGGTFNASNYSISYVNASTGLTINTKALTITGMTASNKAYDGTNTATLNHSGDALVGVVDGLANGGGGPLDVVNIDTSGASGTFNNANVGNGKPVTAAGVAITGADAANYSLTQPATTANITAANLTITADDQTKTYGFGGTGAALGTTAFTPVGLQNGETIGGVTLATNATTSTSTNYNAGLWTITPSAAIGGTFNAANYSITYNNATTGLTINTKALTIAGMTANNKAYDGLTTATLNHGGDILNGVVDGLANGGGGPVDVVTFDTSSAVGSFANANVGVGKVVTATGITLGGADGTNYSLTNPTTTADITQRGLTITASDVTGSYGSVTLNGATGFGSVGLQNGETIGSVTLNTNATLSGSGNYNVGVWTITPSAATGGSFTAGNYSIVYNNAPTGLTVNKANLTVTANNKSKVAGAADPSLTYTITGFTGGEVLGTSDVTGAATLSRDPGEGIGTYNIVALLGTLASSNYDFASFVNGLFSITTAQANFSSSQITSAGQQADATSRRTWIDMQKLYYAWSDITRSTIVLQDAPPPPAFHESPSAGGLAMHNNDAAMTRAGAGGPFLPSHLSSPGDMRCTYAGNFSATQIACNNSGN